MQVPGLRVSPVGVVEKSEKIPIIHDTTFKQSDGHGGEVGKSDDGRERDSSVCACGGGARGFTENLRVRVKFGDRARILIQTMDAKSAFRQIPVDPDGASAFGYVLGGIVSSICAYSSGGEVFRGGGAVYQRR